MRGTPITPPGPSGGFGGETRSGKGRLDITRPPCALCIIGMSAAISIYTGNAPCTGGRCRNDYIVGYRPSV